MLILSKCEQIANAQKTGHATNLLMIIGAGIRTCLHDRFIRTSGAKKESDPFVAFCRRHKNDPRYPLLIKADIEGNDLMRHQLMQEMVRDGWVRRGGA